MNVIHIITGLSNGGAEGVLYRLCSEDKLAQHTVISMMGMGKYGSKLQEKGITVHCLEMPQGTLTLSGIKNLYRILKSSNADVVQTWMYHADLVGGLVARMAGIKTVFWGIRHSTLTKESSRSSTIIVARVCALLSKYVPRGIICCADNALKAHVDIGYARHKMSVIYNGYQLDKFTVKPDGRSPLLMEMGVSNHTNVIGMVGRYNPQKDHSNLIATLGMLKKQGIQFICLLIGPFINSSNKDLVGLIKSYQLDSNIKLLDQRPDIADLMNIMDIHVLSSNSGEGFPNVVAEAMACGIPCVTTDVGDAALIVDDTGWVVPPSVPDLLCEAIQEALEEKNSSQHSWEERKLAARKRIEDNFSLEAMIAKYHRTWQDTL